MVVNGNNDVLRTVQELTELALRTYGVNPGLVRSTPMANDAFIREATETVNSSN